MASPSLETFEEEGIQKYRINYNSKYYIFNDIDLALEFLKGFLEYADFKRELFNQIAINIGFDLPNCAINKRRTYIKEYNTDSLDFYGNPDSGLNNNSGINISGEGTVIRINHDLGSDLIMVKVWVKYKDNPTGFYDDDIITKIIDKNQTELFLTYTQEDLRSIEILRILTMAV